MLEGQNWRGGEINSRGVMSRVLDQEHEESVASKRTVGGKRRRVEGAGAVEGVSMSVSMAEHQQADEDDAVVAELEVQEIDKLAEHGIGAAEIKKYARS